MYYFTTWCVCFSTHWPSHCLQYPPVLHIRSGACSVCQYVTWYTVHMCAHQQSCIPASLLHIYFHPWGCNLLLWRQTIKHSENNRKGDGLFSLRMEFESLEVCIILWLFHHFPVSWLVCVCVQQGKREWQICRRKTTWGSCRGAYSRRGTVGPIKQQYSLKIELRPPLSRRCLECWTTEIQWESSSWTTGADKWRHIWLPHSETWGGAYLSGFSADETGELRCARCNRAINEMAAGSPQACWWLSCLIVTQGDCLLVTHYFDALHSVYTGECHFCWVGSDGCFDSFLGA